AFSPAWETRVEGSWFCLAADCRPLAVCSLQLICHPSELSSSAYGVRTRIHLQRIKFGEKAASSLSSLSIRLEYNCWESYFQKLRSPRNLRNQEALARAA